MQHVTNIGPALSDGNLSEVAGTTTSEYDGHFVEAEKYGIDTSRKELSDPS